MKKELVNEVEPYITFNVKVKHLYYVGAGAFIFLVGYITCWFQNGVR